MEPRSRDALCEFRKPSLDILIEGKDENGQGVEGVESNSPEDRDSLKEICRICGLGCEIHGGKMQVKRTGDLEAFGPHLEVFIIERSQKYEEARAARLAGVRGEP